MRGLENAPAEQSASFEATSVSAHCFRLAHSNLSVALERCTTMFRITALIVTIVVWPL